MLQSERLDFVTGTGHRAAGLGAAVCIFQAVAPTSTTAACAGAVACLAGSTAPDWLEFPVGNSRLITHRTLTHWIPLWVAVIWFAFQATSDLVMLNLIVGFSLGALVHLSGDILTPMGVPFLSPVSRVSLGRLKGGGLGEYLWVVSFWVVAMLIYSVPIRNT